MWNLLLRVLGNQSDWVREHPRAVVSGMCYVGEEEDADKIITLKDGKERAHCRIDALGNVLGVDVVVV